jgi:ribosomal protein L16 Arg81 hydroxylase
MTEDEFEEAEVPFEWRRRAAILLLRDEPLSEVITTLSAEGVPEDVAASICATILTDPTFDAGKWAMGQLGKLESVLDVRRATADLVDQRFEVPRRKDLSRQAFLEEHYATNTPVVLEDVCEDWPARKLWSPEYLDETLGDTEVEVMTGRKAGSGNEINLDQHRTKMPFHDYVTKVQETEWSNEIYLVANNKLLSEKSAAPLWKEFALDKRYQKADRKKTLTFLWFGPGGTVTSLHHDVMNIMFHQVQGWKHFILIAPTETHLVSNTIGVYSDIDPLAPDLERFPRFAGVHQIQVTLGPGDALFVPVGWWHHVTALETSISVSSTSFVYPNTFHWVHPVIAP